MRSACLVIADIAGYSSYLAGVELRLAGPLVAGIGRRQLEGDFPKLKQVLESAAS